LARTPSVDRAIRGKLLEAYLTLNAFPEARPALIDLKARGARLAILSNGSPRMLAAAVEAAGIGGLLDTTLSADTVRSYKPRPEVYALATDALALGPSDVGFVSSNRWDIMGAVSFGFKAFWVNRLRQPDEYADFAPLREIPSLAALSTLDV
jgi:2-haloacid dehalogenase